MNDNHIPLTFDQVITLLGLRVAQLHAAQMENTTLKQALGAAQQTAKDLQSALDAKGAELTEALKAHIADVNDHICVTEETTEFIKRCAAPCPAECTPTTG